MKKNLNQLKWDINYKSINITINDNKKMVKLFSDNYIQFISRIKGTSINSKENLIQILNRKPRSFRKRLNNLVTIFKNFDKQLTRNLLLKKTKPNNTIIKKRIQTTIKKPTTVSEHIIKLLTYKKKDNKKNKHKNKKVNANLILKKKSSNISSSSNIVSNVNISKMDTSKLINPKLNTLTKKINVLKTSLNNNELVLPLNLLNPLLTETNKSNTTDKYKLESLSLFRDLKKSHLYKNYISSQSPIEQKDIQPETDNKLKITNVWDFLINKNIDEEVSVETYFKQHGINTSNTNLKINKLRNLIKNYHDNNITNVTLTKYLKLITPYKHVNAFHQNIKYNFNKNYKYNNIKIQSIFTLLESAFRAMSCFISKPVFMETPDNLIINLFYFFIPGKVKKMKRLNISKIATSYKGIAILNNNNFNNNKPAKINTFKYFLNSKNIYKLEILCDILSKLFNKKIQLDLTPLRAPYFDDNILVKAIEIMSKKIPVRSIFNLIYRRTILYSKTTADLQYKYSITKSFLAGIKIKIGGRLMTQRVIPRKSSRVFQRGAIATGKVTYVDWSRVNLKNKRGAHSITVTMSHVI